MLDKAEFEVMDEMMKELIANINKGNQVVNKPGEPLTNKQRMAILRRSDFKTPLKGIDDIKVKTERLNDFLKTNPDKSLHIIEAPTLPESKPFAMMGTKERTYQNIMKPNVMRAIDQGSKSYIEPFGGVGTSLYHLPDYFQKGLEEAHINMFDIEKYTIVKAMQDGKMNVATDVAEAYHTVIKDITDELLKNDQFKKMFDDLGVQELLTPELGTKDFREALLMLGFHPELAKRFFTENIDAKLVKKGELTETFTDRLNEDVKQTIKEKNPEMEELELTQATEKGVQAILNKPGLFEKQY